MLSILAQSQDALAAAEESLGVSSFGDFVQLTQDIWNEGGWLMYPLLGLAIFIYFEAVALVMRLDRAKLSMPFWWFACVFLGVVNVITALAGKSFVLNIVGMPITDGGASFVQYIVALLVGFVVNPFFWIAIATYKRCKANVIDQPLWETWIDDPNKAEGHVGDAVRFVVASGISGESMDRLEAIRSHMIPDINQKITVLSSLVTLAPLMGLLGTVIGMLGTFRGLGQSSGAAAELVADGIRVALITTQTGLMIAIPGYIFIALAVRSRNRYAVFLTELESSVVQRFYRKKGAAAA